MTESCALRIDTQSDPRPLAALIAQQVQQSPPLLAWAEPDLRSVTLGHGAGRRDDFSPLVQGVPTWPEDVPLVEARLFWPGAALHVVAHAH